MASNNSAQQGASHHLAALHQSSVALAALGCRPAYRCFPSIRQRTSERFSYAGAPSPVRPQLAGLGPTHRGPWQQAARPGVRTWFDTAAKAHCVCTGQGASNGEVPTVPSLQPPPGVYAREAPVKGPASRTPSRTRGCRPDHERSASSGAGPAPGPAPSPAAAAAAANYAEW